MSNFYKWHLRDEIAQHPRGTGSHCGACRGRKGQTKSGEQWDLLGAPPLHRHCGCTLDLVYSDDELEPDGPPPPLRGGGQVGEGPVDPTPDDETPTNPPGTPSGATTNPPPAKKTTPTSGGGNKRR